MKKYALLSAVIFCSASAFAGPITPGTAWYEFSFGLATSPAVGCGDPFVICGPTQNPVADQTNTVPWTFTLAGTGSIFVLDLGDIGDRFEVFDNLISLGPTSAITTGNGTSPCGFDIACADGDSQYSRGLFALGAGSHSITINVIQNAVGTISGDAVFQVTAGPASVPDTGTSVLLFGISLVGILFAQTRWRVARVRVSAASGE